MTKILKSEFEQITQELYIKNAELYELNQELELLQKLYEIIVSTLKIQEIGQQFIDTVISQLNFKFGLVAIINKQSQLLELTALGGSHQIKQQFYKLDSNPSSFFKYEINNSDNLLVALSQPNHPHRHTTNDLFDIFNPLLNKNQVESFKRKVDVKSVVIFPIALGHKNIGAFCLGSDKSFSDLPRFERRVLNQVALLFGVAMDRALLYQDLKKANVKLKQLDKLKNDFIFIATHELKNPVTAMRGYLSMINEGLFGKLPEKMQDPFTQLNASNQQLVELVNDLLQIARTEAKSLTINTETVDLCSIIDVITSNLKPLADQKHLKVIHTYPTTKPFILADPQRVKEIINNLVSNAIKYSDKGKITITHEYKNDLVVTHVTDEGVGISKEDQKKLYTRFFRVEAEAAKGIPGTGLGLYIIKQIIEKMGGEIWLKSEVGKGSTFSFSLPLANQSKSAPTTS